LCAANPNLSVTQLRALLAFNGDAITALQGKSLTGRRLNVFNPFRQLMKTKLRRREKGPTSKSRRKTAAASTFPGRRLEMTALRVKLRSMTSALSIWQPMLLFR